MTKNDIVLDIAFKLSMKQTVIKQIVQMTLDGMLDIVVTEGRLELRNFGVFEVRDRKARKARNPKTGEEVMLPERKVAHFKPGLAMMERVLAALEKKEEHLESIRISVIHSVKVDDNSYRQ